MAYEQIITQAGGGGCMAGCVLLVHNTKFKLANFFENIHFLSILSLKKKKKLYLTIIIYNIFLVIYKRNRFRRPPLRH